MRPRDRILRFEALRAIGCFCCAINVEHAAQRLFATGMPCEIHHQNKGGYAGQERIGDEATVPLCRWHHRGVLKAGFTVDRMAATYGNSLQRSSKKFRAFYGLDADLLARVNERIAPLLRKRAA